MTYPIIKRRDISDCTDGKSYSRGLNYFDQGHVMSLKIKEIDEGLTLIVATVDGNSTQPYIQEIEIYASKYGGFDIEGDCTCPVGFNCKHVVAACLAYQSNNHKNTSTNNNNYTKIRCLSWLTEFNQAHYIDSGTQSNQEFIAYILRFSKNPGALSVQFFVTRHLKKGGLGKGRRTGLDKIAYDYMSPSYAQDIDLEIGKLVVAQNPSYWGTSSYELHGEIGFLVLTKMLLSGRCFWHDTSGVCIQYGEPRPLQIKWLKDNKNEYKLQLNIEPKAKALNTMPALYLDIEAGRIGPLTDADFNAKQWNMLLNAPVIPGKVVTEFSNQLVTQVPNTPLPPPEKIETIELGAENTIPSLLLFGDLKPDGQRVHMMCFYFRYGEYECKLLPITPFHSFIEKNRIIRIQRDPNVEQAALDILLTQGFEMLANEFENDLYLYSPGDPGSIDSTRRWQYLLDDLLPQLESEGWHIRFDASFKLEFLEADDWSAEIESDSSNQWFELRFDLDIQGQKHPLLPLISEILSTYDLDELPETISLPLGNSQYLQLPSQRIRPICQTLYELYNNESLNENGGLNLSRFDAARLADLEDDLHENEAGKNVQWLGGKAMRNLGRKLKEFQGIESVPVPRGLKTDLRPYQQQGLNWLQFLRKYEFNGILADDMGLGKTVQTLAHLLREKESRRMDRPCLIIAPTSLMGNWRREAQQFTPQLKVLILQGPQRRQYFEQIAEHDLILSTYPLLVRDEEVLLSHDYHTLILDEAQTVKNPRAKAAKVVRRIRCKHRLCLTGTPMENHLGELWAQFDFLMPGFLGSNKQFNQLFRKPIENHGNYDQREILVRRISPFMLRRTKNEVIKELPDKTEIIRSVALDTKQAALYESIRLSMEKRVRDAIAKKGLARSHITVLDALLKLRQTCCDPRLLPLEQAKKIKQSAKLEMLMEMLPELIEEGRRILLFSQFTKMLDIIEQQLQQNDIDYLKLTGRTQNRDKVIDAFRDGVASVFLISLKAGGVGLNLTEADTVIHYDPWWNPAAENQATDRAHRIGQKKAVFVYKLITENTVEEKIISMQEQKQTLADGIYGSKGDGVDFKLDGDDLQALFSPIA